MEQIYFGERLASYRKNLGLSQEGLAQLVGVTNQAVSKWESDQCCPDIMLLPALADIFEVSIDELFGRSTPAHDEAPQQADQADAQAGAQAAPAVIADLPWPDDNDLRAVCYVGHRLMDYTETQRKAQDEPAALHFSGTVRDIHSAYSVVVEDGTIHGDVHADDSVKCGDVCGNVIAGDGVRCGDVGGSVSAEDAVSCGNVAGSVTAGDAVNCGNVGGSVNAGDGIKCGNIEGNATAGDAIRCTFVRGVMRAGEE